MFDAVAKHYDHMNKLMSLGMDMKWRRFLVENLQVRSIIIIILLLLLPTRRCTPTSPLNTHPLQLRPGDRVLDLATGTADVAILVGEEMKGQGGDWAVLGVDPSEGMLEIGRGKVRERGLAERVTLVQGDAQELGTLESDSFDKISMSFGIRNVEDRAAALREMARVARKRRESVVAILEFALPTSGPLLAVAQFMVRYGAPLIGSLLTGLTEEYQHLQRSILNFPPPKDFAALMGQAGLEVYDIKDTGFGVVTLYLARPKLEA
jgi:demethylmenaquinone methyltransferase/2-methoxy-6-polyprenyl-1,4-benzoquinol methylase